jgi:uncharacterized membrane protein
VGCSHDQARAESALGLADHPRGHSGACRLIQFERVNGGTRLDVEMSYSPPAGVLGHVVAKLFGADPKTELDEDLLRMKTFLETGKAPCDAAAKV